MAEEETTKKKAVKKTVKKATKKVAKEEDSEAAAKAEKIAKLREKAKALEESVKSNDVSDMKSKVKISKTDTPEKADGLVPIEDYLKSSIHLGTRVITPDMKPFVYKRRADGLAVFNTALLDDKIIEGAEYLAKYAPEDVIVVCKREAGWKAVELFSKVTGIRSFTKKYPAGIMTNPELDNFIETELVFICDPWLDKNALADSQNVKVPVLSVCDTNNYTQGINQIIPGNNKSAKSLGMIFYLLTKLYVEKRKLDVEVPPIEDFIENWENLVPPK